jgi:AcrR family transcriptional regulator
MGWVSASEGEPRRRRAPRGEGGRLREELLLAASALLRKGGERALKIREVAEAVGVTTPAVYLHFRDKAGLIDAVCLRAFEGLEREMLDAASSSDDPFQALRLRAAAYVRFALDHAVEYELLMAPRVGDPHGADLNAAATALFDHLIAAVEPCVAAGVFRGDPQELTLGIWAAIHGCVMLMLARPQLFVSADAEGFAEHVGRMSGLGTALLSRVEKMSEVPPSSETFARVLDAAASNLAST